MNCNFSKLIIFGLYTLSLSEVQWTFAMFSLKTQMFLGMMKYKQSVNYPIESKGGIWYKIQLDCILLLHMLRAVSTSILNYDYV